MAQCCNIEPEIVGYRTEVTGDDSPDTQTKVFTIHTVRCRNPRCPCFGTTWEDKIQTYPKPQE